MPTQVGGADGGGPAKKKRVVVVGGGVAGSLLAKYMQSHAEVVLIDPKEYFEIPWANLRSKVEPVVAEKSVINHIEYLTKGRTITTTAIGVTETMVLTADGRSVEYDFLVIATGHTNSKARSRRCRLEEFHEDNMKIKTSGSILIIGGGPTGVELAGEIIVDYPDKKVTLVHKGSRLIEFLGEKASNKAIHWLESKKVRVLLDQSIDLNSISETDRKFKTSAGVTIEADCYFPCVSKPLSTAWLKESFLKDYIDVDGRLVVNENMKVGETSNVFAIGDITNVLEAKQGFFAQRHAGVVAKNLKLLITGRNECKLVKYRPSSSSSKSTTVTLGRREAVMQMRFATVSGFLPGLIKSRDLFVRRTRRQMGLDSHHGDELLHTI